MKMEKGMRLLYLYHALMHGDGIQKQEAAKQFEVDERTIQRDIENLRNFFAEQDPPMEIAYRLGENRYRLEAVEPMFLTCGEALAVCKILLESRSMARRELDPILDRVIFACLPPQERQTVGRMVANERFTYIEPRHGKLLADRLWTLGQAVQERSVLQVRYRTQTGQEKQRALQPVGLLFSEFYFYLAAFIEDIDKAEHFENADDLFPTIYRVDRLEEIQVLDRHFSVPYAQRFSEGEFRKRIQFMYGGRLQTVRFPYCGPSVEAVLDRLPTAEIVAERDGSYDIKAEVFGKGIEMWLRSQGDYIIRDEK